MRKRIPPQFNFFLSGLILLLLQFNTVTAQELDAMFAAPLALQHADVDVMFEQRDGKIVIGSDEDLYYGDRRLGTLIRINSNGTLDRTFNTSFTGSIDYITGHGSSLIVVRDGEAVVVNRKGTIVENLGVWYPDAILSLPDLSILISEDGSIYKLNPDYSFNDEFGYVETNGTVYDMKLQGDKIVISGSFDYVNGLNYNYIARITKKGVVDESFNIGTGSNDEIESLVIQPDLKILLGNTSLSTFNDQDVSHRLVRLNADGSLDQSFVTPYIGSVQNVGLFKGKIFVFDDWYYNVRKYNLNGSLDESFKTIYYSDWVEPIITKRGEVLTYGDFNQSQYGFMKHNAYGYKNLSFKPSISTPGYFNTIAKAGDKLVVTGEFIRIGGINTKNIAVMSTNGVVDANFKFNNEVGSIYDAQGFSDGSILMHNSWYGIQKITATGEYDQNFNMYYTYPLYYWSTEKFKILSDDTFFVLSRYGIGKRNADGSMDGTFTQGYDNYGQNYWKDFDIQSDGKIVYAGYYSQFNGVNSKTPLRLNTDGSVDGSFNVGNGINYLPKQVLCLPDNSTFIRGYFWNYNGNSVNYAVKINDDGSYNSTFTTNYNSANLSPWYYDSPSTSFRDGMVLVTYSYTTWQYGPIFVNNDGTVTESVIPSEIDYFNNVNDLLVADDNTIYMVGEMWMDDGSKQNIVKVTLPPIEPVTLAAGRQSTSSVTRTFRAYPNPTTDYLSFDIAQPSKVVIYSMDGVSKVEANISSDEEKVDVRNLNPGRYVIKLLVDGKVKTEHFIKK